MPPPESTHLRYGLEDTMKLTKSTPTTIIREDFENLFDRFFGDRKSVV